MDTEETPRTIDSAELLQGQRIVLIRHRAMLYELRLTELGNLYLTKHEGESECHKES